MSLFQTIAAGEIDRSSPLTGAVVSAPARDSVMEKLRERDDYLEEVIENVVSPTSYGLTADRINPDAIVVYNGAPAGGDGLRIFSQLKRQGDSALQLAIEQRDPPPPTILNFDNDLGVPPTPRAVLLVGAAVWGDLPPSSRSLTQSVRYTEAGAVLRFRLNSGIPFGEEWVFNYASTFWEV